MNDEPQIHDINQDDNEPATKGDIDELAQATKKGFDAVDHKFDSVEKRLDGMDSKIDGVEQRLDGKISKVQNSVDRMLTIVESIDSHYKEHRNLPAKVDRLSEDVFKLMTRTR